MTPLGAAQAFTRAGINVIPLPRGYKKPVLEGWPKLRLTEAELPDHFNGKDQNMGAILGVGNLVDLDLDCTEAIVVGSVLAEETGFVYGHDPSGQPSHYFYRTDTALRSITFRDPASKRPEKAGDEDSGVLLEARSYKKDGTVGLQSVLPWSVHPNGEMYKFAPGASLMIQTVDASTLEDNARRIAAGALFARYFARTGLRHETFLALAGILARAGWTEEQARQFCFAIYLVLWHGAADMGLCKAEVKSTFDKYRSNAPVSGIPRLKELIEPIIVNQCLEWLGISGIHLATVQAIRPALEPPAGELAVTTPLGPAAFYGIAGEFVRIVEPETEADSAALLIQFLVVAGIWFGRDPHFLVGATKHYTNIFAAIVGETSQGRKGTSLDLVLACFDRADTAFTKDCITSGLSSGEGLIYGVRDPIKEIKFKKGTTQGTSVVTDPGVEDKRLCVVEGEFSRVLKVSSGPTNILSAVLRSAWDTGNLNNLTKNTRLKASNAHIGIIGHIVKDELLKLFTSTEAANGFGNRFLWVPSERSKALPDGGNLPADALDGIKEGLVYAAGRLYPGMPAFTRDADARALWHEVYAELSAGRPGLVGALTGRGAPIVMRIALIFAALDCKFEISLPHLQAALEIWRYCGPASIGDIFGDALGDDTADQIWKYLKTVGTDGATRTDIYNYFGRNKSSGEYTRALAVLARHGHARMVMEETGGRQAERWFACQK